MFQSRTPYSNDKIRVMQIVVIAIQADFMYFLVNILSYLKK